MYHRWYKKKGIQTSRGDGEAFAVKAKMGAGICAERVEPSSTARLDQHV